MKSRILLSVLLLSATVSRAQPPAADYAHEVGLNVGIAPLVKPWGSAYQGSDINVPYFASLTYHYNFNEAWQAGISLGMMEGWNSRGSQVLTDLGGQTFRPQSTTFIYTERSWEATARFNHVTPFYDSYQFNYGNLYYGVAAGALFTVNTNEKEYAQVDQKQGPQYRYLSKYSYAPGTGWVVGLQVGYAWYFSPHIGIQAELAPRYVSIGSYNNDQNNANEDLRTIYFPASLGLKVRF